LRAYLGLFPFREPRSFPEVVEALPEKRKIKLEEEKISSSFQSVQETPGESLEAADLHIACTSHVPRVIDGPMAVAVLM